MTIRIPTHAKRAARKGLLERKFNNAGLSVSEAKKLGVTSGVSRAKQIINSKTITIEDAKRIGAFYDRFKNCRTERCETAIKLWGGRKFGKRLAEEF